MSFYCKRVWLSKLFFFIKLVFSIFSILVWECIRKLAKCTLRQLFSTRFFNLAISYEYLPIQVYVIINEFLMLDIRFTMMGENEVRKTRFLSLEGFWTHEKNPEKCTFFETIDTLYLFVNTFLMAFTFKKCFLITEWNFSLGVIWYLSISIQINVRKFLISKIPYIEKDE